MSAQKASTADKSASSESVTENWERLTDRIEQLRKDLSEINTAAGDLAKAGANEGRDRLLSELDELSGRVSALAEEVGTRGRDTARRAGEKASALSGDLEDTINRNPIAAVLIAVGLGFLIGMATRSRN
jgi:ElaB/YqjD/DUF883 family membrane-anchored ribosome-binding protein